jgi:GTP cyclohydrolase IIa
LTLQLTILRIEGYGAWTLTLGSDREADLQMLQAQFYLDTQRLFSEKGCLVYLNRFDEYFVVTNGLSSQDHLDIMKKLGQLYNKLQISMAIGKGNTAYEANIDAYKARNLGASCIAAGNVESLNGRIFGEALDSSPGSNINTINVFAQILHIDIDSSVKLSSRFSPFEITLLLSKIYLKLSEYFLKKESLTFFIGGDNFMVLSNGLRKVDSKRIITKVSNCFEIKMNCGIGIGRTGRKAAEAATKALDTIRDLRSLGKIQPVYEIRCL